LIAETMVDLEPDGEKKQGETKGKSEKLNIRG
jgi:hypothetical protein